MSDEQELERQHMVFQDEAFGYLLHSYGVEKDCSRNFEFFRPIIGEAILVISYIFKKVYLKTFSRLRDNLKHIKMFEHYCKIIPVNRENFFFYYYLRRVSIIFELAMYCYNEDFNYFKAGRKCVMESGDIAHFESAGKWGGLEFVANLIAKLGRPLTLIVEKRFHYKDVEISTFEDAVKAVWKHFTINANFKMLDSKELACLLKLGEKFKERSKACTDKDQKSKGKKGASSLLFLKTSPGSDAVGKKRLQYDFEIRKVIVSYLSSVVESVVPEDAILSLEVLIGNPQSDNPSISKLSTPDNGEKKSSQPTDDPQNSASVESHSIDERKDYGDENIPPTSSKEESSVLQKNTSMLEMHEGSLSLPSTSKCSLSLPSTSKCSVSPQRSESVTAMDAEKTTKVTSEDTDNSFKPSFIIPERYLNSKDNVGPSQCKHLFSAKMCPPSPRKTLDERLKKIMDDNINNQNYNIMPSGDIFVHPKDSPSVKDDTLIVFAESSSDEEGDKDMDTLTCLFKKIETEIQGSESGYLLRPRPVKELEEKLKGVVGAESGMREMTACDKGTPSKFSRRVKRTTSETTGNETRHAEVLINLYRKYFVVFLETYYSLALDKHLNIEAIAQVPAPQPENDEANDRYVFAVSTRIMAKRRVLLDTPDEKKPIVGLQVYSHFCKPRKFPLCVQQRLDSEIRNRNFFEVTPAVYGVGRREAASSLQDIWAVLVTQDEKRCEIDLDDNQALELAHMFSSFRPVIEIFAGLDDDLDTTMRDRQIKLNHQLKYGFYADRHFKFVHFNENPYVPGEI